MRESPFPKNKSRPPARKAAVPVPAGRRPRPRRGGPRFARSRQDIDTKNKRRPNACACLYLNESANYKRGPVADQSPFRSGIRKACRKWSHDAAAPRNNGISVNKSRKFLKSPPVSGTGPLESAAPLLAYTSQINDCVVPPDHVINSSHEARCCDVQMYFITVKAVCQFYFVKIFEFC